MPFNMNKLTEKAQEAVLAAQELAQNQQHGQIEPEHLIYTLLTQADGVVPQIIRALGANAENMAQQFNAELNRMPNVYGAMQPVSVSPRLGRVLENSMQQAGNLH
jgi:ATP-dependent Clp protease ATP-binding subunit ClpB